MMNRSRYKASVRNLSEDARRCLRKMVLVGGHERGLNIPTAVIRELADAKLIVRRRGTDGIAWAVVHQSHRRPTPPSKSHGEVRRFSLTGPAVLDTYGTRLTDGKLHPVTVTHVEPRPKPVT